MSEPGDQFLPAPARQVQEQQQLRQQAQALVAELAQSPQHSPEFRRLVASLQALGQTAQIRAARAGRSALPPVAAGQAQALAELRQLVAQLQPPRRGPLARLLGRRPALGPTPEAYAEVAARSGPLLEQLYRSQDELRRQQATLGGELDRLAAGQAELERALALATELDQLLSASLPELEARQPLHAAAVRDEALYAVRGQRTDLSTALATAAQARLALDLTRQQAAGLDEQLGRAAAGVVTALKLARRASQAAAQRAAAAEAGEQLKGAQQRLETAASLDDLNAALRQAYAALDDLEQLDHEARTSR
ncbi:toxic anion resistance protein [Deinococcus sp. Marseille-Q6407]|uniref:toxic anion resistance protein n=1 Tax=Deinococcus sp. Marseille-Q6407 TaxID=2969223 RepID=UPI0021BE0FD5|nr:toxic anion resistance protein [Deinococcus sp. Marseille-Q6407]